jgi:tetratricopeptide (TPR) repeat protein
MRTDRWFAWLIVLAGLAAYANSFTCPFVFDDYRGIHDNPHLRHPLASWQWIAASGRPVVMATLAANYAVSGLETWSYHLMNLAIHVCAALALYGLVRRTLLLPQFHCHRSAAGLAAAAAVLWVVHPLQTESVTYLIQRAESLMGLFYLLTLYCTLRAATTASHSQAWAGLAVGCCALGMGSKEVMVTAPLVVLLYDRVFLAPSWREVLQRRWPLYAGLAATWLILIVPAQVALGARDDPSGGGGVASSAPKLGPLMYALSEPGVLLHYLRLAIWPYPLCLDYGWPVVVSIRDAIPSLAVVLALLTATIWALWRFPALGFLGASFFIVLAPTSSFMPIVDLAFEHRLYLPLASLTVLAVLAGDALLRWARQRQFLSENQGAYWAVSVVAIASLGLAWVTRERNRDYRSEEAIWTSAVAVRPQNVRGRLNLGLALAKRGGLSDATDIFAGILENFPDDVEANHALGWALLQQGRLAEAETYLRKAMRLDPDHRAAQVNLGLVLFRQGEAARATGQEEEGDRKTEEAIVHLERAVALNADDALAHFNLAQALVKQKRRKQAEDHYREALRLRPDFSAARRALEQLLSQST